MTSCRKRDNHVNGKQTAQSLGWRRDYKILAPAWLVTSYNVNNQKA
jgi:hypothetical protein